jgi:endonuclease YncB( thermonuclease family)
LAAYIGERPVTCVSRDHCKSWNRIIARCYVGNVDLGAWTVQEGWALAYLKYSRDDLEQERSPREAGRGMHAGLFIAPWEWRQSKQMRRWRLSILRKVGAQGSHHSGLRGGMWDEGNPIL